MNLDNMVKIALCGKANTGKNTVADLIADNFCTSPIEVKKIAFADPIKKMIEVMFPWADRDCLYGSSKLRANVIPNAFDAEGKPLTYRQLLIDLGTQGRKYNPNHWIDIFDYTLKTMDPNELEVFFETKMVVCTDVRFVNEFNYLKSKHFFVVKIFRDSDIIINHSTETNQDGIKLEDFDFVLNNNGTLDDLKLNVAKIVNLVKNKI